MEDMQLIDYVERYLLGEMNAEERSSFEALRRTDIRVDQMVVEHTILFGQISRYNDRRMFNATLDEIHADLVTNGEIVETAPKATVIQMLSRYSRLLAVAASIAGFTALSISGLVAYFTPKTNKAYVEQLSRKVHKLEVNQNMLSNHIKNTENTPKIPVDANVKSGGTSFMIDSKGYLVTNAHVIGENAHVVVQNSKGQEFKAKIVRIDANRDLAFLKIEDGDFKPLASLPYGFRRTGADLGEEIFTLGYPRDEIVYGEGYMSARTGFNGDTLACQIAVAANPGNSGGPVINKNGEVVGILSTRQVQAEGVVFAIKTRNIFNALDELRQDSTNQGVKMLTGSTIKGLDRVQQIKKIQDFIFMVKTY